MEEQLRLMTKKQGKSEKIKSLWEAWKEQVKDSKGKLNWWASATNNKFSRGLQKSKKNTFLCLPKPIGLGHHLHLCWQLKNYQARSLASRWAQNIYVCKRNSRLCRLQWASKILCAFYRLTSIIMKAYFILLIF